MVSGPTCVVAPGASSRTLERPRRWTQLPAPSGATTNSSGPSRRSEPGSAWSACRCESSTASTPCMTSGETGAAIRRSGPSRLRSRGCVKSRMPSSSMRTVAWPSHVMADPAPPVSPSVSGSVEAAEVTIPGVRRSGGTGGSRLTTVEPTTECSRRIAPGRLGELPSRLAPDDLDTEHEQRRDDQNREHVAEGGRGTPHQDEQVDERDVRVDERRSLPQRGRKRTAGGDRGASRAGEPRGKDDDHSVDDHRDRDRVQQ